MKKKALFLVLIGILTTPLLLISWELPAQIYHEDDVGGIDPPKKEPSARIKQLYKELESKISQLEKKTELTPYLKDAQKEIKKISREIKDVQPKIEPETAESRSEVKLNPDSRALIDKKRELQAELHIADIPLMALKDRLAVLLKKKEKLESEYFLVPIEIPILAKTTSELKGPIIIIEGEVKLRHSDDINITLALERGDEASVFCEVYLNDTFIKRERWKIGPKKEFTTAIAATHKDSPRRGPNNLVIVLNTSYQEDDIVIESPSFEENPLVVINESKVVSKNLISGSFKLRQTVSRTILFPSPELEPGLTFLTK